MRKEVIDLIRRLITGEAFNRNVGQDGKISYYLKPKDRKICSSQRARCVFGLHVFMPYHLIFNNPKKDSIYKFCPICGKIGKMLQKPRDLTSGMSRG
ncbi:MAG: hypothetical protein PHH83_02795 [Patescibacteria group bacterium]|nr:hypothetical protein [Patescibacteria group bacterium]